MDGEVGGGGLCFVGFQAAYPRSSHQCGSSCKLGAPWNTTLEALRSDHDVKRTGNPVPRTVVGTLGDIVGENARLGVVGNICAGLGGVEERGRGIFYIALIVSHYH